MSGQKIDEDAQNADDVTNELIEFTSGDYPSLIKSDSKEDDDQFIVSHVTPHLSKICEEYSEHEQSSIMQSARNKVPSFVS